MPNPQKSEVHAATGDASTSPTAGGDQEATRERAVAPEPAPTNDAQKVPLRHPPDARITRDETDQGGPLVIETDNPDLEPKGTFPTERGPQERPPTR